MAGGTFGGGTGDPLDPYIVEDRADFEQIAHAGPIVYPELHYKQANDIDFEGANWVPLGGLYGPMFSGTYDGQGFKIEGMDVVEGSGDRGGLFRELISGAKIINLHVVGVITGGDSSGLIAGYAQNGSQIIRSKSHGNILKAVISAGGLVGRVYGGASVEECYSSANVSDEGENLGAIAYGGIFGEVLRGATITDCYATGSAKKLSTDWTGAGGVGGFIGAVRDLGSGDINITNCYSTGEVVNNEFLAPSSYGKQGGLIGNNEIVTDLIITNSFYDSDTSGQSDTGKGVPKTTAEMKDPATYTDWDFKDTWVIVHA